MVVGRYFFRNLLAAVIGLAASGSWLGLTNDVPKDLDQPIELNEENVESWRVHIHPDESEMAWKKIPWLPTLREGILKATEQQRPVLLWVMNGHPLGCT
ncbi:MAG: hypothetical protein AB8B55_19980 [Mariniblastus sp.]